MNKNKNSLLGGTLLILSVVVVGWFVFLYAGLHTGDTPDVLRTAIKELKNSKEAADVVKRAWLLAQQAGAYEFATDIEQTTYYPPALTNVGRHARVEHLHIEGKTNSATQNFEMAIWQGGSVLNRDSAFEVRAEGDKAFGRRHGGNWQEIEDFTGLFAPNRDMLAYLHGIKNVREVNVDLQNYRKFNFSVDGPAFAEYMRLQLEDQLRKEGKLPLGVSLGTPQVYRDMVGNGELWLAASGLPVSLNISLEFPQKSDGSRIKAVIHTDFSNFSTEQIAGKNGYLAGFISSTSAPTWIAERATRILQDGWQKVGMQFVLGALCSAALALLVAFGRRPKVYAAFSLTVIVAMVVSPLLRSAQVAAFSREQAAAQAEANARDERLQAQQNLETQVYGPEWDGTQSPLENIDANTDGSTMPTPQPVLSVSTHSPASSVLDPAILAAVTTDSDKDGVPDADEPAICRGSSDCDNDTLTDLQEYRLGTSLDNVDSDGDNLRDDLEVKGFLIGGRRWYSNPLAADTNRDGLPDTLECWGDNVRPAVYPSNQPCTIDSDSDGVPDIFAYDNDGDGVDDKVDYAPFYKSSEVYNYENAFSLQVDGLTPHEPLFVDFQIVPTSPNQLSYARNVLDWPVNDTEGQIQRTKDTTFATGKPEGQYLPSDENGDLRLVPLVEITIPATDASNLLPTTRTLAVNRGGVGYKKVETGSGSQKKTEYKIWLRAKIELRGDNGTTALTFAGLTDDSGADISVDRVKIFKSSCPVKEGTTPEYHKDSTTKSGDGWSLGNVNLPSILDGKHVLMFEQGSGGNMLTACIPLGDVPNGKLPAGWMFDTASLSSYGINLRDVVDAQGEVTNILAYVPANVGTGMTGGEKQFFSARMAYMPANVTSLGDVQKVRLVWAVQLLGDDGNINIVHTYSNEGWRLAGLTARQDFQMRTAVIYQNPDKNYGNDDIHVKAIHEQLWAAARVLMANFVTVPERGNRLTLDGNLIPTLEREYGFPLGSLQAAINTYDTQDDLARIPAEVVPTILPKFITGNAYKPGYDHVLLLFAREETYKSVNWHGERALTLPPTRSTLTSCNWMPFRYVGGNWESFPISKYLDLLSVRLDDALKTLKNTSLPFAPQDRAAWQKGVVLANQAFAISMFVGQNRMAVVDNSPIKRKAEKADETVKKIGEDIVGTVLETIADEAVDGLFGEGATSTDKKLVAIGKLFGKENTPIKFSPRIEKADAIASGASTAMTVAALGLTLASLFSSDQAGDIMEAVTASMEIIGNVVETGITVAKVINQSAKVGFTQALRSVTALSRAAKIGMVVGVVLSVALSAGLFIAQWASGAFGITDLAFTSALAGVIAAVIVAVIMVAIASIPIVGQIIAAVIAIIDAVIAGICAISKAAGYDLEKATTYEIPRSGGAKLALCEGISGFLAQGIKFLLFSQTSLVGNMQSKDRLTTSNFQLGFRDPGKGFQVGNSIQPSLTVDNKIKLADQPFDWKSLAYFWQFNWDNLDDATFRYDLSPDKSKRNVSTGQMESEWQEYDPNTHNLTGGHRSPGIQYDDPLTMVPVEAELAEGTSAITFQSAGINVPVPLYLRESYANPVQECWIYPTLPVPIPICYIRSGDKGTNHIDLQLKFDIFPATLDEFYQPAAVDGGYSLAWGQSGKVTFPKMRDFDGDGLLSPAFGGTDPDDRLWDADGDGLGDTFEMQKGTNPRQADTDDDGIDDRQELILGSNPLKADGDGDGLLDGQEVFHQGRDSTWSGGWEFVYDIVDGVSQATWVASDPTRWNSDTDTLSDAQEKIYGLNPNAVSDPTILKMASQVRETNAPVTLLRFDERAGAVAFSDSSGLANNATCSGDTCPAAGHEGKYINGLIFDGVDDFVTSAEAFPLANHSFTVAAWVRRDATNASHAIFSIGDSRNPLLIGFRNDNSFICAFGKALVSSVTYTDTGWHHWACTYDAATKQRVIYRDGWMVASDTTSPYQGSGSWIIGKASFGGWQFNGALDEVAVVPAALDILQIGSLMDGRYNPGGAQVTTAPGEWLTYEAKLENNLLGKSLVGLLSVNTPPGWFSAVNPTTYFLNPAQTQTLQGNLMIDGAAASGTYNLSLTAGAAAVPVPSPQPPSSSQKPKFSPPTNGLVARWAFEYNGDDLSGHNSHASLNAGASYVPAFKGAGINLNGSGNYVSVPQAVANTRDFTFAAWVYWRGGREWQRVFDFGRDTENYIFFSPRDYNGKMLFQVRRGSENSIKWVEGPMEFPRNTWVHLAVTLNGQTARIYINGVEQAVGWNWNFAPSQVLGLHNYLGKSQYGHDPYFDGMLDEVYIYDRVLSAGEIHNLALAGVTDVADFDSRVAGVYLPFDNHYLDYNSWNDSILPSQANGVPRVMDVNKPGGTFLGGMRNTALNFNGNTYVELPNNEAIRARDFTFAAWVYWRGGKDWQRIFDFGHGTDRYMMLAPNNANLVFWIVPNGWHSRQELLAPPLPRNQWVHVAVTLSGNTARMYINGVEKASNANITANPSQIAGANNWLGKSQYGSDPLFDGMLDEVYIMHRALSAEEVNAMAHAQDFSEATFTFDDVQAPLAYEVGRSAVKQTGALAFEPGVGSGQALRLDGKTVLQVNSPSFDMHNTPFTYAVWVKPDPGVLGTRAIFGQPPAERDWQDINAGLYLWLRDGRHLQFGWGGGAGIQWSTGWLWEKVTPGAWNHVAITFDAHDVRLYVNGREIGRFTPPTRPKNLYTFAIGESNLCAEFELKNVLTVKEGDPAWDPHAEYVYEFWDERGVLTHLLYDGNADSGEWEPGDGPRKNQWFNDKKVTYCGNGARVHVWEDDGWLPDDPMGPDVYFNVDTPDKRGYGSTNFAYFASPDLRGDGTVRFYYEIHNPVLPFKGALDELHVYRRALSTKEVQQLYATGAVPYHYTFDDPPGAGLNSVLFNFKNEGSVANPRVNGFCNPGACPTSGLPGRNGQAVSFTSGQSIQINDLELPATAPGFSLWVKPSSDGHILRVRKAGYDVWAFQLRWQGGRFCLQDDWCSRDTYPSGKWVHLMVNFGSESHENQLYVNKVLQVTVKNWRWWQGSGSYQAILGDDPGSPGEDGFTGLLDDFRIPYDGANVEAMYDTAPSVLLHLEEDANAVSFVNVGGVDGTCTGSACPDSGRRGKVGQAAVFDGRDDVIQSPGPIPLANSSFTVMFWARRDSINTDQAVFSAGEARQNKGLHIGFRSNNTFTCAFFFDDLNTSKQYTDNTWNHWACVYDATTRQRTVYRNGVKVGEDIARANYQGSGNWMLGDAPFAFGDWHFNGALDEVQVYGRALQSYEIQDIYTTQANWTEERDNYTILVDGDAPVSSLVDTLPFSVNYYPNANVQLAVKASDATSEVTMLELGYSRNGGPVTWVSAEACQDASAGASSSPAWCPWFKPVLWGGEGRYVIQTRATDAVGNRETPAPGRVIIVDGTGPSISVNQPDGSLQNLTVSAQEAKQYLLLNGTVSDPAVGGDPGSGVDKVWVTLRNADGEVVGDAPYPAVITGNTWSLQYPFRQSQVSGSYILEVAASDKAGNQTVLPNRTLILDGTAPEMVLSESASNLPGEGASPFIKQAHTLSGWYSERPFPADAVYAYPFEEPAGATSFANILASTGWQNPGNATCSGSTCPASGGTAYDGLGVSFDGVDDYLRLPADVVQADAFAFAAWVNWRGGNSGQSIFAFGKDSGNVISLTAENGALVFRFTRNGALQYTLNAALPINQWVHVAVALQSDTARLYVNGVEQDRKTGLASSLMQIAGTSNWLGRSLTAGTPYFNGQMDQVVVYPRALNGDEVRVLAATRVAGVQSLQLAFTPLWTDAAVGSVSPGVSQNLAGQTLYLPLDEARARSQSTTYRNLADSSASASCSSANCPEASGQSPAGGAASFDGIDDYISVPGSVTQTDDFTFAAWVNWRGGKDWQRIFDFGHGTDRYMMLAPNNANLVFWIVPNGWHSRQELLAPPLPRNQWVHVAVTLSGNTARMYINGVEKASNANITANPSQIAGANNWLGKSQYAWDPYFNGSMNDVRVFNRALSSAEIHSLWQGTRAVLVLPFDESSAVNGAALQDASGWEYYATLQSGANDTAEKAVWGNIGSHALYFDGVDDRVVVPHAAQLSLDRFTISLWVNPTSAQPNWHALLSKSDSYGRGRNYALFLMPGSTRVHAYVHKADCASYTRLDSGIDLPLNTWSHVSLTYDGAFLRLYINGKLDQSAASTGGLCQTNNDIWIGKVANAYDAFHGALDDIRIYPRALNTAEIADLGNAHWRHTNVSGSLWALNVPAGLEGVYRIETRAADSAGHTSFNTHAPINQTIDSLPPRLSLTREVLNTTGSWNNKKYKYVFRAEDLYLDDKGLVTPCGTNGEVQKEYRKDADSGASVLVGITVTCTLPQPASSETASVRDVAGNTSSCSAPGVCTQPLASLSMPVVSTALPGIASDAKSTVLPSMNAEGMQDTGMANVLPDSIALARFDASTPFTSAWNASTHQSENTPEGTFWGYLALQVLKPAPKDGVDESTPESPSGDNVSTVTIVCRGDSSDSTMCADLLPSNGFAQGAGIFETSGAEPMGAGASSAIAPSDVFTITGTAGPETILLSAPPNPAASSDAAFTFTSDDPAATFECQLDGGGFAACVSPQTYAALLDGLHTFNVRAIDLVGNPDPTPVVYTWTVDTIAPDTTLLSTPTDPTASTAVTFTFNSDDPAAMFECQLDGGSFAPCDSPQTYTGLLDGLHTFDVRAMDLAGNVDPTPAVYTWTVDSLVPDTILLSTPPDPTASTTVTFTFGSDDPAATFECQLDGGGFAACVSPQAYAGLLDGLHTFEVRAMDLAGNLDPTPAVYTWTVDTIAPDTALLSTPPNPSTSITVTFAFTSSDPTASFECQLDGGGFAACASPQAYAGLLDGLHTFDVRAVDLAGNVDPTPAVYTWTVDLPPETTILSTPPDPTASTAVTFTFSSDDPAATFECQLDGGGFAACVSPQAYAGLLDGLHTFEVRAVDLVGNPDPTPAVYTWTVDTIAPDTALLSTPPNPSTSITVTFAFTSSDPTASFECQLDGGGFAACASPQAYAGLLDGLHTFDVRAVDLAGNVDPTPAVYTWTVDLPPETTILSTPTDPTASTAVTFTFSSDDPAATFECQLDGGGFAACVSPQTYAGLLDGLHTFEVRAVDLAGNPDPTPAVYTWTVDTIAPDTTLLSTPPTPYTSTSVTFTFTSNDSAASFECQLDGGGFAACASPQAYTGLAEGLHTFDVRAVDLAGNIDPTPAVYTWTVDLPPDTTILSTPPDPTASTVVTFTFGSNDPAATFECQLDGGGFMACASPQTYAGLSSGVHVFDVRAVDVLGNRDATPASYSWNVLLLPPGSFEFLALPEITGTLGVSATIQGIVVPPHSLTALTVTVQGTEILTETHAPGTVMQDVFNATWMPLANGIYTVTAMATDEISGTATISGSLIVDTAPPEAILSTNTYTTSAYTPGSGLTFNGILSDTTGIISATAVLTVNGSTTPLGVQLAPDAIPAGYKDGRPIYPMTSWSANWWSADTANLPDYTHASLTLTVYDASLIPTTFNFPIVIDLMPPVLGKVTLLGNSQPMTTSHTYRASLLSTSAEVLTTTDASGSVSMWYGWTESITSTVANLTPVVNPGMQNLLHQDFLLNVGDGGKAYFFHVQAVDGLGNRIRRIYGPYYHDLPAMPDYINPLQSGSNTTGNRPYRGWQDNGCTLLGVDERIADLGMDNAALASPQALHLTWDATRLHMLWTGANWDTDGDLFIYLDTIPGQGSQGAYNPYTSTMQSTVLLLPAREEPVTLNINAMQADYAVWVTDTRNAHLLHWNGSAWVDAGALDTLGGFYSFNAEPDGAYTDLILPFDLIGNPTEMSLVAFAVDAEEGPSGGLRIWSILPYANPADSPRVVPDAPGPDQPHRLMLTDRYTIAIADGTCLTPEANLEFAISTNEDAFYYNPNEDAIRLILPAPSVNPNAWNSLFAPYDDQYQTWLTNTYCPTDPTFPECHKNKPPASLDDAGLLNDVRENQHPPLLPGTEVTYTLHYANPLAVTTTVTAYLYSNDDLYNPEAGVAFKGLTWLNGCTGWLALTVPPGVGNFVITGVVQPTGVHALNLDIEPAYTQTGCSITGDTTSLPEYRLRVTHTPDDGAPGYVAILPSFTQSGPISATIPGVVRDAAPVDLIEFRVNGSHTFTCVDDTPSDGQWRCLWDVVASNGGTPPANGTQFTLQVRATDAFGHQSAWSTPWSVTIDAQSPQMAGSALDLTSSYLPDASQVSESLPINDTMIQLAGAIADNTVPQGVEICTKNSENCVAANLTIDPYEIPPTTYRYTDSPASPVTIDNASACGVHTQGMTRNFVIDNNFTIANVSLGLRLEHPYRSDLSAVLQAPSGTEVQIFHFDKNVLAENIVALFSDDATDLLSNDLNSHALEDSYQSHVYRPTENLSRFSGEQSAGVWTLILCDSDPTSDTGTFYEASLDMEAVAPPLNITGNWTYNVDVSGSDGITYTWTAYAVDIYGNRTKTPYVMTALVDNIPPVITATQVVSKALVGTTVEVLHGLVVDGDAVTNVLAEIIDPTGNVSTQNIVNDNGTWTYTMTLTLGGDYEVSIYATDRAGNKTSIGLFTVSGLQPLDVTQSVVPQANVASGSLVTYTVAVANPNTNEAAENIVLRSTLSQWLTPTLLDGGVYTNSMVVWQIPTLPAGEMLTKTVVARLPEQLVITATLPVTDWVDLHGATLTSFARAETSNLGTSDSYQTSFEIEGAQVPSPQSPMTIQKAVSDTSVPLGALVTYTIQMTNTTDTLAENIIISDTLIPVLSPVSLGTASFDPASRTIVWPSFSLAAGESIVLTFTTRLTESQAAVDSLSGYLSNQAFFTSTLGSGASNIAVFTAPFTHTYYLPLIFGPSPGTSPFAPANEGLPSESAVPPRKDTSLY